MFSRTLASALPDLLTHFPAISVTGPRQSGKTTLCRQIFQTLPYVLLEDPDTRLFAETDPRRFLDQFPGGAILDEVQRVPSLFSYLQGVLDADATRKFVLSGSQNFLMMEQIRQSLAGRVGLTTLLPLAWPELNQPDTPLAEWLFHGGYPARAERQIPASIYFASYLQTYLERDVRSLKNIGDLTLFTRFVKLCAGRVGQLLNVSSLATDAGLSPKTAEAWLSVLETSYVVYRLQPYHQNWGKRLTKTAKLYFLDTGLLCYLLDIQRPEQVLTHFAYGSIFENAVLLELMKADYHAGRRPSIFFGAIRTATKWIFCSNAAGGSFPSK